ncbi:hypothetical protein YC2023_079854 [Brassica napus]
MVGTASCWGSGFELCAPALFSTGGLQWVAWGICKVGLRALLTVVLVAAHCGSLPLPLHSSELPAVWRSSPLFVLHLLCAVCATPEVVYLSCPIVLYGFLVKWVYTVPVDGLEGGNLRERLLNDGIAGLCHYLVPLVVEAVGIVQSRFEGAFLSGSRQPSTLLLCSGPLV